MNHNDIKLTIDLCGTCGATLWKRFMRGSFLVRCEYVECDCTFLRKAGDKGKLYKSPRHKSLQGEVEN